MGLINFDAFPSIFSCEQWAVGSGGTVEVPYTKGGQAAILVPDDILQGSGFCRATEQAKASSESTSNGGVGRVNVSVASLSLGVLVSLLMWMWVL